MISSDQRPPGDDWLMRRLTDLERQVRELQAGRRLEAATIGAGGLTVAGGTIRILDPSGGLVELGSSGLRSVDPQGNETLRVGQLTDTRYGLSAPGEGGAMIELAELGLRIRDNSGAVSAEYGVARSVTTGAYEMTDSSIWGDLTTVGPVVSNVRIGSSGRCLVFITSTIILLTTSGGGEMAYEISGATTVPTGDSPPALAYYGPAGSGPTSTRLVLQEGLNPGFHTFTAKYRAEMDGPTGLGRFGGRNLTVLPL
ncbi:hypothetical protein ABZ388_06705 [Micromonospora parva]|uniref:hypothetical protein n=1 Tax=Micromonospora parva TaxID=1464048 RepID=UPI0033E2FE32